MVLQVRTEFKNLPIGLLLPEGELVVLTGANNSGKSAILQYLNIHSELRDRADYVSPRRFDLSNEVAMALNSDQELQNMWNQRKDGNTTIAELTAPDPIRELLSLANPARTKIQDWHNRYFGELHIERSKPDNDYAPARITIDGRLATQQGSGSRAVLSVLCSLLHPSREIVLIDEPEIGIEPLVQKKLANLIRRVSKGLDNLPKKRVYIATHSHLFLDKVELGNNWVVTKGVDGKASLAQIKKPEELHNAIYRLLGNSPEDLFFPDNILIVEGPSDEMFWRRLLALTGASGVAVHYADGETNVSTALPAIEQMLKTQAYIPWYRDRLCVAVDSSVPVSRIEDWRKYLGDNGIRVRALQQNGIEHYYPQSILRDVSGLTGAALPNELVAFISAIRHGVSKAALGGFNGSKRDLAKEIATRMDSQHLPEIDTEILQIADTVKAKRFSVAHA